MALGCEGWPFSFVGETKKKNKIKSRNLKMGDKVVCVRRDGHGRGSGGNPSKEVRRTGNTLTPNVNGL